VERQCHGLRTDVALSGHRGAGVQAYEDWAPALSLARLRIVLEDLPVDQAKEEVITTSTLMTLISVRCSSKCAATRSGPRSPAQNRHEWAKRQLEKRKIACEALDYGFLSCA
jgi:hypothetical protein